jgi:nicotinamidase-related amidase
MAEQIKLDPQKTALIMVDMQNDFCHPEGFFGRNSDKLQTIGLEPHLVQGSIPKMKELLEAARSAGVFVVHTCIVRDPTHSGVRKLHDIVPQTYAIFPESFEDAGLVPGTWGSDTHEELKPLPSEYVLIKRAFSSFYQTDLEMILRRKGIRTVVIAGTVTYVCCLHTAFDAHVRDFDVAFVSDGTASWAPELQQPIQRLVDLILGASVSTSEVIAGLRQPSRVS